MASSGDAEAGECSFGRRHSFARVSGRQVGDPLNRVVGVSSSSCASRAR